MKVDCQTTYQNIIKNVNDIFRIDDIFRMKIYLDVYVYLYYILITYYYSIPLYFGMSTKWLSKSIKRQVEWLFTANRFNCGTWDSYRMTNGSKS